jgi:ferrochelatase
MRHWAPWIEETIRDMLDDGITHAISLVLAPHYSSMSVAKYQ